MLLGKEKLDCPGPGSATAPAPGVRLDPGATCFRGRPVKAAGKASVLASVGKIAAGGGRTPGLWLADRGAGSRTGTAAHASPRGNSTKTLRTNAVACRKPVRVMVKPRGSVGGCLVFFFFCFFRARRAGSPGSPEPEPPGGIREWMIAGRECAGPRPRFPPTPQGRGRPPGPSAWWLECAA